MKVIYRNLIHFTCFRHVTDRFLTCSWRIMVSHEEVVYVKLLILFGVKTIVKPF